MAGIAHLAIRQALRARLLTVGGLPTIRAWENQAFTPPEPPAAWIRETLMPATNRLFATNLRQATGIAQYDLFYPVGTRVEAIEPIVDAIQLAFNQDISLGSSPTIVVVEHAERGRGDTEEVYYRVPVFVSWRAFGANI